jgi:hypothetical protein
MLVKNQKMFSTLRVATLVLFFQIADAVTIYGQEPLAATFTAPGAKYTGLAAYNPTVLNPPPIPNPPPASQYTLQLPYGGDGLA